MAAKETLSSFLTKLFLLLHIGCFLFTAPPASDLNRTRKKRKSPAKLLSSSWSFLTRVFSSNRPHVADTRRSNFHFDEPPRKRRTRSRSESDPLPEYPFFPLRNDIFPCSACGGIFPRQHNSTQHNSTQHAISELRDDDPSKNVTWIIFNSGWKDVWQPRIHQILKIHNSPKTLARFEEFEQPRIRH